MNIYVISNNDTIFGAYLDKNEAKTAMIHYIKSVYNQDENNIYIDEYEDFILYNFKSGNSWLTLKINKVIVK